MVSDRRHRNLLLGGAALLWALALGGSPVSAQATSTPAASAKEQSSQGQGGGQQEDTPKGGSDAPSDEKSKDCPAPPPYKLLRYEEDYSYLKDPSCRTDFWDPIKYVPLGGRDDWYLSVGGELRERYEFYHEQDAGAVPANARDNGYMLERYLLHGDLHLGPYFRFFGQFVTGLEDGRIGGPRPDIDRDAFDVHQAFADFVLPLGGDKDTLTARLGRQEFEYGSGRLIDVRDGPNLRLSFDAARLLLHAGDWKVDGWWSRPVRNRPGVFDDDPDPTRSFWGLYAVHPLPMLPQGNVDLYYLGFENQQALYVQGAGYELRHSLGTRLWGRPLPWEYNLEYVWQFGTFGSGNIEAWSAANAVRYNFSDLPLKPRLGLRFDVASGDNNPGLGEPPDLQPAVPLGHVLQPPQPGGAAQHDRPAPDPRPLRRGEGHRVVRLGLLLAGEPGRRCVPHLGNALAHRRRRPARTSGIRRRSRSSGTRRDT